ncbi:MAG: Na/Pi cotransporter family protein [Rhizobiaceae bacterium]
MDLDSIALTTGLIGGLALFLFGMDILTRALKQIAGFYMKTMLARMTRNRIVGVATGAVVTAIIQSSSVTTVLLVGFISAGLMSTSQSVAVILGANIGTTVTAQILAFKVNTLALPILATGFFVSFLSKRAEWRQYGRIALGLGLVFFGMAVMSESVEPLRSYKPFLNFMVSLDHPLLAALIGAAFTAIIQSSSATTGILIVAAGQGLIGLEAAIAIALGSNIGTCVTAGLASIGRPPEAIRAALVHILFNVVGVLIWIGFVDELATFARYMSPAHPQLSSLARTSAEVPRQIANIHTFFNLANAALFIGFTTQLTRLVERLVPDRIVPEEARAAPQYLDEQLLDTPAIALDATRREIVRLGGFVQEMLENVMPASVSGARTPLDRLRVMDRPVDLLHRSIIGYLRKVSLGSLSPQQSDQLVSLIKIANDLEHIGDQVATRIVTSARKRLEENVVISPATVTAISGLHSKVLNAFKKTLSALENEDHAGAEGVRAMKQDVAKTLEAITRHEISRLQADEPQRLTTYAREIELIEILDGIFETSRRIAGTEMKIFDMMPAMEQS